MTYNKKQTRLTNTKIIELAFDLQQNQRVPTESEKELLKKYAGFGGIKAILNPINNEAAWKTQSDIDLKPHISELHEIIRQNTGVNYQNYIDSLRNSVLSSFSPYDNTLKSFGWSTDYWSNCSSGYINRYKRCKTTYQSKVSSSEANY